jgi:hypothetical protein
MTYFKDQLRVVTENLRRHGLSPDLVDFRVDTSRKALVDAAGAGEPFDFILIDAGHKIHCVMEDLRWTRLLTVGGIVCLHDYGTVRGVTMAADRFLESHPNYEIIGRVDSLLTLRKAGEGRRPEVGGVDRVWASAWAPVLQLENSIQKLFKRRRSTS